MNEQEAGPGEPADPALLDLTKEEPSAPIKELQLDLTKEEPNAPAKPFVPGNEIPGATFTPEDWTRIALAGSLVGILAVLTLGAGWFVVNYPAREKTVEAFLQLVFTPIIGLVGSVIGFYFGSRAADSSRSRSGHGSG
jgi:hypothetical protein